MSGLAGVWHLERCAMDAEDAGGDVVVFDGRLDNRDELLECLPVRERSKAATDYGLILAAWRAWGEDFLPRLAGEFALALYHSAQRALVLARDPVGCRPLYYHTDGDRVVFASQIKAILRYPHVRAEPNADLLADFFVLDRLPYDDTGETFFKGIHAVPPGYALRFTAGGIRSRQFWDFNRTARIRYRSYDEYADHLRSVLTQAVRRRLRSPHPVAIAASGGLDSSVVACLADEIGRTTSSIPAVRPMACVLPEWAFDNSEDCLRVLESARGLRIERIPAAPRGDIRDVVATVQHAEWPRFDEGWSVLRPLYAHARATGVRVVITGNWSDQILFVTGYLSDLTLKGSWRQVARHLGEYTRWFVDADPRYFRSRFRRELLLDVMPERVRVHLAALRRRLTRMTPHPIFGSELVRRADRHRRATFRPRCATAHARNIYQCVRAMSHRLQFEADQKLAASCGIEMTSPFLDRDVIQYLMSIPGDVQTRGGVPRALLRDAVRGLVPHAILERRWRTRETPVDSRRDCFTPSTTLAASHALGFVRDARPIDDRHSDLLGLEFWSRVFFSDTLTAPQPSHLSQDSLQGAVNL